MAKGSDHIHINITTGQEGAVKPRLLPVMVRDRREGKTTSLVETLRWDTDAVLVVHSASYAGDLERQHDHLKGRVYAPDNLSKLRGIDKKVYVDNAELVLANLISLNLAGITLTGELI